MKSLLCFKVIHFNPNWSLESKHTLFFIEQIVWLCKIGVAGYVKLQRRTRCR